MTGTLNLEHILGFLLETPMFGDLDPVELSQIVHIMQVQHTRAGKVLFYENAPGAAWYVVYEGEVEVLKGDEETVVEGTPERIALLGPKSCFGEMAILDGSPRSATVRSHTDATLFRFPRDAFQGLLSDDNLATYKLVYQMARVLVARQRQTTLRLMSLLEEHEEHSVREGLAPLVEAASPSE